MHIFLIALSSFLAVFGFAFGLAGLIGMMRMGRKRETLGLSIADAFLTGGLFTFLSDLSIIGREIMSRFLIKLYSRTILMEISSQSAYRHPWKTLTVISLSDFIPTEIDALVIEF